MKILLDENKRFFKANLHCHSTYSDGKFTVENLKEEYKKRGYSIVAFTDHEHLIDNSHLNDDEFLTITSCEMAIKEFPTQSTLVNFDMRVCHLNFYALDQHNTTTPCYSSVYDHYITDEIKDLIRFDKEYERVYTTDGINDMIKRVQSADKTKRFEYVVIYSPAQISKSEQDYQDFVNTMINDYQVKVIPFRH